MENFLPFRARYAHRKVECCHAEKENPLRGAAVGRCAIHPFPGRGGAAGRRPAHWKSPRPAVILAEAETGTVIFEKSADERREVASITKLMTALLVFEALEDNDIALTDQVTVSQRAAAMEGSQALLDADTDYKLEDLLRTMIMASANDSAVALAEYLGRDRRKLRSADERARSGPGYGRYPLCKLYRLSPRRDSIPPRGMS